MKSDALFLEPVHASWQPIVKTALGSVSSEYLQQIQQENNWLPGPAQLMNAFSQPLAQTRYLLLGESPYPRAESANGFAFWDAAVTDLWSDKGLSKPVNRATSLRNIMKMLLLCEGALSAADLSQPRIASLDKSMYIKSLPELFEKLLKAGFVLLNATPVLSETRRVTQEAKYWQPFLQSLLTQLQNHQPNCKLLLFGNIAKVVQKMAESQPFKQLVCEHPYNLSFITNPEVMAFFKPFNLLRKQ